MSELSCSFGNSHSQQPLLPKSTTASLFFRTSSHGFHDLISSISLASMDSQRRDSRAMACQERWKTLTNVSYTPLKQSYFLPFPWPVQPSILSSLSSDLHHLFSIAPRRPHSLMTSSVLSSTSGTFEDYPLIPSAFRDAKSQDYSPRH
jgi:hypothetical protein